MPTQGVWLQCNGQSTAAYPALAAIVGSNVPDYRGVFLRGYGSQTSYHYNTVTHSSGALGALQGDTIRNIIASGIGAVGDTRYYTGGAAYYSGLSDGWQGTSYNAYNVYFDASRVIPTSNENRPINKAVQYLIKAG